MTAKTFAELMAERMVLVEQLAALNSKQLLNTQTRAGIEIELESCLEEIKHQGSTSENVARRAELEDRLRAAVDACATCDQEWTALNDQLHFLDQELQGAQTTTETELVAGSNTPSRASHGRPRVETKVMRKR